MARRTTKYKPKTISHISRGMYSKAKSHLKKNKSKYIKGAAAGAAIGLGYLAYKKYKSYKQKLSVKRKHKTVMGQLKEFFAGKKKSSSKKNSK